MAVPILDPHSGLPHHLVKSLKSESWPRGTLLYAIRPFVVNQVKVVTSGDIVIKRRLKTHPRTAECHGVSLFFTSVAWCFPVASVSPDLEHALLFIIA